MSNKTVRVLEVKEKYESVPEFKDIYVIHEHFRRYQGYPCVSKGDKVLVEPDKDKHFQTHRLPIRCFARSEIKREPHLISDVIHYEYVVFDPKLQGYFDMELEKETREIKENYLEKERRVLNREVQADFEVTQARTQVYNLRKTFQEKQQSWAEESSIGHIICFILGCLVTTTMILGG